MNRFLTSSLARNTAVFAAGAMLVPAVAVSAQEAEPAPAVPAPPPPPKVQRLTSHGTGGATTLSPAATTEPRTFLGVATSPADPQAREMAELPEGVGLVVASVTEDSPAAAAGLVAGDVLHKLNDQLLVNTAQLSTLIRMHDEGEEVELSVIRGSKPMTLTATLEERELPAVAGNTFLLRPAAKGKALVLPGAPGVFLDGERQVEIQRLVEEAQARAAEQMARAREERRAALERLRGARGEERRAARDADDLMAEMDRLRDEMDRLMLEMEARRPQLMRPEGAVEGSNVVIRDDDGTGRLTVRDGGVEVRIEDADGADLYVGGWPSEEEMNKLSQPVQRRLEQLKKYAPKEALESAPEKPAKDKGNQVRMPRGGMAV